MPIPFFSKLRNHKHYYDLVRPALKQVEELIEAQTESFEPTVADYMETICKSRGKLLRPALTLLMGGATGGIKPEHIRLGTILEMVHLASLVHDDVIDRADTRRNEPTANALWGNNLAVLLGDALFSHAMVLGTDFGSVDFCKRLAVIVRDVCQGEVEQSSRLFDLDMTREDYFEIIRKKTASLFSAATGGASWISGVNEELESTMYRLGVLIGSAYQIYDDCLDMVGDEDDAGKTLHTDAEKGKLTLPIFNLLDSDDEAIGEMVHDALERRQAPDYEHISRTEAYREAIGKAVQDALRMTEEAREILWLLPQTPYREALAEMTFYMDELLEDCCGH